MSHIGNPRKGFNVVAYNQQKADRERSAVMSSGAMGPCPPDSALMKAWTAYKESGDYANTRFWATTEKRTTPERATEMGLDPTVNVATPEMREQRIEGSLWSAFMAGFAAAGGKVSFP